MEFYKSTNSFFERRASRTAQQIAQAVPVTYCSERRNQRTSSRGRVKRVVFKSGVFNIERSAQRCRLLQDLVGGAIRARWRCTLAACFLTYVGTWLAFSALWWLIVYVHGDLDPDHLPRANATWTPCIKEIYGFTSTFLFSIEIHTTIGYGSRILTLECPTAIVLMCIEGIVGTIMQSFIVGVVFAKLTRPKSRAQTLVFSKNALISQRDRHMCLIFRVGNIRKSRIIAVNVDAYLIKCQSRSTDHLTGDQVKLDVSVDACDDIIFMWPVTVVHKIDESSPFYSVSAEEMLKLHLEILVVLEGTIESTGQPVQLRSSYTRKEILWGHRFAPMISYRPDRKGYEIDYSKFDDTIIVTTPLCSPRNLTNLYGND